MNSTTKRAPSGIAIFLGLFCLALLGYGQTLTGGFVLDDYGWASNARVYGIFGNNLAQSSGQSFFRPVGGTTFGLIWSVFGPYPPIYHFWSLLLLVVTGFVLIAILRRLSSAVTNSWWSVLPGTLFVFWASHCEAVVWIGCFPDVSSLAYGVLSLWAWLVFYQEGCQWKHGLPAALLLFLALGSKETAIILWVVLAMLLYLSSSAQSKKSGTAKVAAAIVGVAFLETVAFWAIRTQVLGHLVGGYKSPPFKDVVMHLMGQRGFAHLSNLYFPLAKPMTLWFGSDITKPVVGVIGGLGLSGFLYFWPKKSAARSAVVPLIIAGLSVEIVWAVGILFGSSIDIASSLLEMMPVLYLLLLLILAVVLRLVWRKRWRLFGWVGSNISQRPSWVLVLIVLLTGYIYSQTINPTYHLGLLLLSGALILEIRPYRVVTRRRCQLFNLIAVTMLASLLATFITLNIKIGVDGQQGRFSYFGSAFSVIAISAAIMMIRRKRWRTSVASLALVGSATLLVWNNAAWVLTGRLSNETASVMLARPSACRIYVLVAPGTVDGAGAYQVGLTALPFALRGVRETKVKLAFLLDNARSQDTVEVKKINASSYDLRLVASGQSRWLSPGLIPADPSGSFHLEGDGHVNGYVVYLVDFQPGDLVMIVTPQGAKLLE